MNKYEQIYAKISKIYFVIHALVLVLVLIASFFPFQGDKNFYKVFRYFPGMPFLMLGFLLMACLMAYLTIKRPWFSILVTLFSYVFFSMMVIPYAIESLLLYVDNPMPSNGTLLDLAFGAGFDLMNWVSRVTVIEVPFMVYAIVVAILKKREKRAAKKAEKEFEVA